ncbi:hypothetical protein [Paenibacillus polymyxa]|uniref:hypothetical protein n=1 Tax=Paenibacillus polymyxa TaxID=1406 RepID=UPI0025B690B1|nr:hypothetical protein [Paenibacillus polymyxa]MDN4081947.1 hypothetical protein [Paenibacillus polymyxa]MDN4087824.1 hypothetical protein [Paenibacillus polymyxa]MDN4107278.1 hypothetical protein [Paenibacillus polymyxa]
MSERTFFFRDKYNLKEMFERIYAPEFIEAFKQHSDWTDEEGAALEINKSNCFVGLSKSCNDDQEQMYREMETVFLEHGRKGDKLNVKLYKLDGFDFSLTEQVRSRIEGYKSITQNIKDLDTFSPAGLKYNLFIEDTAYKQGAMDVKFKIEVETFVFEPTPKKIVDTHFIEVRLYHSTGLTAVFNPNGVLKNNKVVLTVLHLLFHFQNPNIKEVVFDEAQLLMIQLKLNGQVSSPRLKSDGDLRVEIHGLNDMNYGDPLVQAVNNHGKLRIYELSSVCTVAGHRFNLKISEEGRVQVESFVESYVLDRIITDIDWVILTRPYFKQMDVQIEELLKRKSRGSLESQRAKKSKLIQQELVKFFKDYRAKGIFGEKAVLLTCTIILNIAHFLMKSIDRFITEENLIEIDSNSYTVLNEYLADFAVVNIRINRTESLKQAEKVIGFLKKLIISSTGDPVKLIENVETMIRTD